MHVVEQLQQAGHEVAVWSALDRKVSRDALIAAGVLEIFDDVVHMDAMMRMDEFAALRDARWITLDQLQRPKALLIGLGIAESRLPLWLGWIG